MNKDNYCTLEAAQRLIDAGIVLETDEEWKDIVGYECIYLISNHGRVFSFKRTGNRKDRILKPFRSSAKGAYCCVSLNKDGVDKRQSIHRLVATAFIDNPLNYSEVNHKDGNPSNNHVLNLEWVSRSQNQLHAYAMGMKTQKGEKNSNRKLTEREVSFMRYIRGLYPNISTTKIADFYGVAPNHITKILAFKQWNNGRTY